MIQLLPLALVASLALAGTAQAQDAGAGGTDPAEPPLYQGPIVGGKKVQPTQGEITDRLMQQRESQPETGGSGSLAPAQSDPELDQLYQLLQQQSGSGGQ